MINDVIGMKDISSIKNCKSLIVSFVLIYFAYSTAAKPPTDSLSIVNAFTNVLKQPVTFDSIRIHQRSLISVQNDPFLLIDTYWFNVAKTYLLIGDLQGSSNAVDSGLFVCQEINNRFKEAKYYNLKASIYSYQNKYEEAISFFQKALQILEEYKDFHSAALIKNNIANLFFSLSDYNAAYTYSLESFIQLNSESDTINLPPILGILAISSLKLGKYEEAKKLANQCLNLSQRTNNLLGNIIGNHSMGELFSYEENYNDALIYFQKSLELSEKYQQKNFILLNNVALQHVNLKLVNYDNSILYGKQALALTEDLSNQNPITSIHKNLAYSYAGKGFFKEAFSNMQLAFENYINSAGVENQRIINDILIKYDTEKKENEISKNRLELIQKDSKIVQRNTIILFLILIMGFIGLVYYFIARNQKLRLNQIKNEQETKRLMASIHAEEKERERISGELHDGVASSLTAIKFKVEEALYDFNPDGLKNIVVQLSDLHEETRRISHNLLPIAFDQVNWVQRIESYCLENSSSKLKIHFKNNLHHVPNLGAAAATLIYRSIQELIHNVQRHSDSPVCYVQLVENNNELIVSVEDEGKGFSINENEVSQGHASIEKRLKELNGYLLIDSEPGKGCLVTLHIQLNHENYSS